MLIFINIDFITIPYSDCFMAQPYIYVDFFCFKSLLFVLL